MCCHPDQIIFLNALFSPLYRLNKPPTLLSEQKSFLPPSSDRVSDTDAAQLGQDLVSQYADRDRDTPSSLIRPLISGGIVNPLLNRLTLPDTSSKHSSNPNVSF